jgi:integrase
MAFSSPSAVDLMDGAPALPTGPQQQQDQRRISEVDLTIRKLKRCRRTSHLRIEEFGPSTSRQEPSMTETTISPLRQRMIDDMTVRHFIEKTRTDCIRQVRSFAAFLGRSPDTASPEDIRQFQLHLTASGVTPPSRNAAVAALRFFFTVTLDRADLAQRLILVHEPRKVPLILSPAEVARLLEAAPGPKYKAALSAAYGAGLRVSDVASLKVCDIDSQRMLLPALRQVPWRGGPGRARRARSRAAARALLPYRVHAAGRHHRPHLPQRGRDLRSPV